MSTLRDLGRGGVVTRPLLWHLPISHYSEKVRWALDWKRIPHRRRIMPPGMHPLGGVLLTRGKHVTMPVLEIDGERIGDSTAIIEALQDRFPEHPLYPADGGERRRALELEDWFDENVGPYARRWAFKSLLSEPDALHEFAVKQLEWAPWMPAEALAGFTRWFVDMRYSSEDEDLALEAQRKLLAGLDRLEAELDGGEFLAGGRFTVADLTAAALYYPIVLPPEGPWVPLRPQQFRSFQDSVRERFGYRWVEDTFRRHRHAARAGVAAGSV